MNQHLLVIGNEMNRAAKLLGPSDGELLGWRDLVAALLVPETADPQAHAEAFRYLLRFTPAASAQIPLLLGPPEPS